MLDFNKYDNTLEGVKDLRRALTVPLGINAKEIDDFMDKLQNLLDATRVDQPSLEPGLEGDYVEMLNGIAKGLDDLEEHKPSFNPDSSAVRFLSDAQRFVYASVQQMINNQPDSLAAIWFDELDHNLKDKLAVYTNGSATAAKV